jgi:hypothetical protein
VAGSIGAYYFVQTERATQALVQHLDKSAEMSNDTLAMVNKTLKGTHANGDDGLLLRASLLVANADSAANALKQTAQTLNAVTKANQPSTAKVSTESLSLIASGRSSLDKLTATIGDLDGVVTDLRITTLPKVNAGVDSLDAAVAGLQPVERSAATLLTSVNDVSIGLKGTVTQANALLSDPDLTAVARNLAAATASGASAFAHIDKATGYIEYDLSPKHEPLWRSLISEALSQAIGIPLKYLPTRTAVVSSVPVPVTPVTVK